MESTDPRARNSASQEPEANPRVQVALAAGVVSTALSYAAFANSFLSAACFASMFALSLQDPKQTNDDSHQARAVKDDKNAELILLSSLAQSLGETSLESYKASVRPKIKAVAETVVAGSKPSNGNDEACGNEDWVLRRQIQLLQQEKAQLLQQQEFKKELPESRLPIQPARNNEDARAKMGAVQSKPSKDDDTKPNVALQDVTLVQSKPSAEALLYSVEANQTSQKPTEEQEMGKLKLNKGEAMQTVAIKHERQYDWASVAENEAPNYTLGALQQMADDFGLPPATVNSNSKKTLLMQLFQSQVLSPTPSSRPPLP